jgi:DUF917 family protein
VARQLHGRVLARGHVSTANLAACGGFTRGVVSITAQGAMFELPVLNQFLAVGRNGQALATFPDLITLFDTQSGLPLSVADIRPGQAVAILWCRNSV